MGKNLFAARLSLLFLLPVLVFTGCSDFTPEYSSVFTNPPSSSSDLPPGAYGSQSIAAKTIYNPYLLENVRREASLGGMTRSEDILATHYYIRFRPATDELYFKVKSDSSLDCFSYPLDVEVPEGAMCYIDNEQPEDAPQFIFTWVPVNYVFPGGVDYDILGELVLGDLDAVAYSTRREVDEDAGERGIFLSGSGPLGVETDPPDGGTELPNDGTVFPPEDHFQPGGPMTPVDPDSALGNTKHHGRITVWDDLLGKYVPLQGVKVRVRKSLFNSMTTYTDADGRFEFEKWMGTNAKYSIDWETGDFEIRSSLLSCAGYAGPNSLRPFNLEIGWNGCKDDQERFATIHRALWRYHYGDAGGLTTPQTARVGKPGPAKMVVRYRDVYKEDMVGKFVGDIWNIVPHIEIYGKESSSDYFPTWKIFAATSRKAAQYTHSIGMGNVLYWLVSDKVGESWGAFAEYLLTRLEYTELEASDEKIQGIYNMYGKQWWPYRYGSVTPDVSENKDYSPIFIDLWDDVDQSVQNTGGFIYPDDQVTGYTPATLNRILFKTYGMTGLKSNLKADKPSGVTDAQIDNLFKRYEEIWNE